MVRGRTKTIPHDVLGMRLRVLHIRDSLRLNKRPRGRWWAGRIHEDVCRKRCRELWFSTREAAGKAQWLRITSPWCGGEGGVIKECDSGERQMLELTNIMVDRFEITFDKAIASTVRYEWLFQRNSSGYEGDSSYPVATPANPLQRLVSVKYRRYRVRRTTGTPASKGSPYLKHYKLVFCANVHT